VEIREQVSKASDFFARKVGELALAVQAAEVFPPAAETDVPALLQEIADLRRFAYLNYLAVVKAVKKRNRHLELAFGEAACEMQAATLLLPQAFFSSPLLSNLATRLEVRSLKPAASAAAGGGQAAGQLNCPICLEVLRDPVVLNCAHRFCFECLSIYVASREGEAVEAPPEAEAGEASQVELHNCPVCRVPQAMDLENLQVDELLSALARRCQAEGPDAAAGEGEEEEEGEDLAGGGTDTGGNEEFRFAQDNCSSGSECSTSSLPGSPMAADGRSRGGSSCGEELCFSVREGAAEPTGPAPLTVALDLDHTLICSVADGSPEPEFPHLESWLVYMPHVKQEVRIYERPGVREFLAALRGLGVELQVFTAGLFDYATPILDRLEEVSGVIFDARYFRDSTLYTSFYSSVKDLCILERDLARVVLVDDNPMSFSFQPKNGVLVPHFSPGPGPGDNFLCRNLLPVLRELAGCPDVRPVLDYQYRMTQWFVKMGVPIPELEDARQGFLRNSLFLASMDTMLPGGEPRRLFMERIAPDLAPKVASVAPDDAALVPDFNALLAELQARGVSPGSILKCLSQIRVSPQYGALLKYISHLGFATVLFSDSNLVFTTRILAGSRAWGYVSEVATNPAHFVPAGAAGAPAAVPGADAQQQREYQLCVEPRSSATGCPLCPANMCRGAELAHQRLQRGQPRVVFVGQDRGDACAAQALGAGDVLLLRAGSALSELVDAEPSKCPVAASVRRWNSPGELLRCVQLMFGEPAGAQAESGKVARGSPLGRSPAPETFALHTALPSLSLS